MLRNILTSAVAFLALTVSGFNVPDTVTVYTGPDYKARIPDATEPEAVSEHRNAESDSLHPHLQRLGVDFISKETNFADSLQLFSWAPQWARQYLSTLIRGNVDRTHEKLIDMSFAVTPSYTREAGFGIGGAMTALYRVNRRDSTMNPSDIFFSINASLKGFFVVTLQGNNLLPDHRSRITYKLELYRKRLDFWGINSEQTGHNAKSRYDRRQIDLKADYVYKINRNFYAGLCLRADYTDARNVLNPEYLLGERRNYYVTGLGLSLEYDTRDNLVTPTRGVHLAYKPMFYSKYLGSAPSSFLSHSFIANTYLRLWHGAVAAYDLYASFNASRAPWTMREMVASDGIRMRGYYMGSYMDNCQIASQIELRQNIYKRIGMTVWGGCATVFYSPDEFRDKDIRPEWLPNWGIGLRFEVKHNVNARIDYGFGRNTSGILFAIGEAF